MTTLETFPRPLPRKKTKKTPKKKGNKIFTQNKISKLFGNQCFIFLDKFFVVFYTKKIGNFFGFCANWTYFATFLDFFAKFFTSKPWRKNNTILNPETPKKKIFSQNIQTLSCRETQ
jgi:hypothetical protein